MTAPALALVITTAGLERFTAAQLDEDVDLTIAEIGLTDDEFVAAPTLTALPGEFRRLDTLSGAAVGDNIVHLVVRDEGAVTYTVRGFGLFLADGTLFAVYGQAEAILQKAVLSTTLIAIDIAFPTTDINALTFGNTNFLNPPATTITKGVVELATEAEAIAGEEDDLAVTPAALKAAIDAAVTAILPVGFIGKFYGDAEDVPEKWAICDGQTVPRSDGTGNITTPDFRNRTAVGAGDDFALGDTFGAFSKTVASANAGAHTHNTTLADHTHAATGLTATVASATTGATINYTTKTDTASGGTGKTISVPPDPGASAPTLNDAGHVHGATVGGNTANAGGATVQSTSNGAHAHDVTMDVAQPSLAVHFIMRI